MRRLLVTAAIAAVLLTTACSGERDGVPSGSPATGAGSSTGTPPSGVPGTAGPGTGAPSPGPGGSPGGDNAPAGGNAREVCDAATKASADSVRTFIEELGKSLQATGANDTAGAEAAQRKAEQALQDWGDAMREQAGRATDARLKAVLTEIGTQVGSMEASVESVDETKLDQLQQRLDQLCGV